MLLATAAAGDVHGLQQQLESMVAGLTQLEGVSTGSMRRLEEQSATLADAVAVRSGSSWYAQHADSSAELFMCCSYMCRLAVLVSQQLCLCLHVVHLTAHAVLPSLPAGPGGQPG